MNLKFIWAFAKFNGIAWMRRSPANILANIISPLCLLFIIYVLSQGRLLPYAAVGGVVAIIAAETLSTTGQSAMYKLEFKLQELLVATRVSVIDYIFGFVLSGFVFCIPGIALFTILGMLLHLFTIYRFLDTISVVFVLAIATTSISMLVGSRIKRTIGMWAISGILSALLTLIPPTFYPYTSLPPQIFYILAISPVTPASATLQGAYGLTPVNGLMLPLLIAEAIFYLLLARSFVKWREK